MTADRRRQQHELNWLLTYFYRGHNRSTWTPADVHHPQLTTTSQSNQPLHQHLLVRWHFIAKPPRLKDHQRQPLEWTPLNGRRRINSQQGRCVLDDGCGGSVLQQLTCEWRPKEKPRFGGSSTPAADNEARLHFDEGWHGGHQTAMTLTCFVVGRSLFFVRLDLKWFRLSVEFRRMAAAANGQQTEVDMFAFPSVAKWQERELMLKSDERFEGIYKLGQLVRVWLCWFILKQLECYLFN